MKDNDFGECLSAIIIDVTRPRSPKAMRGKTNWVDWRVNCLWQTVNRQLFCTTGQLNGTHMEKTSPSSQSPQSTINVEYWHANNNWKGNSSSELKSKPVKEHFASGLMIKSVRSRIKLYESHTDSLKCVFTYFKKNKCLFYRVSDVNSLAHNLSSEC